MELAYYATSCDENLYNGEKFPAISQFCINGNNTLIFNNFTSINSFLSLLLSVIRGTMAHGEDPEVAAYTSTSLQLIKSPLAERDNIEEAMLNNSGNSQLIADTYVGDGLEFAKVQTASHFLQRHC
jgi:hypothetical protein